MTELFLLKYTSMSSHVCLVSVLSLIEVGTPSVTHPVLKDLGPSQPLKCPGPQVPSSRTLETVFVRPQRGQVLKPQFSLETAFILDKEKVANSPKEPRSSGSRQ